MNFKILTVVFLFSLPALAQSNCAKMQQISIPQTDIVHVEEVPSGKFVNPAGTPLASMQAFCRVQLSAHPRPDAHIGIEVWLPIERWNGRLLGTGNGGFGGHIQYSQLANGVHTGYATANTDLGTNEKQHFFSSSTEVLGDWASRSTHLMTVAAQALITAFYGQSAKHRTFLGCSSGGQEGITEAEQYPNDYDGIVSGAPANDRVDLHIAILWNWLALHHDGVPLLSQPELESLSSAAASACSSVDGVVTDPSTCKFDPAVLACKQGEESSRCLSDTQIAAVKRVYSGPVTSTGKQIFPGLAPGGETQWGYFLKPSRNDLHVPYEELFVLGLGEHWSGAHNFKVDQDTEMMESKLSSIVDATTANLDAFKAHGGKMIVMHGWEDPIISPFSTVHYFNKIRQKYGAASDTFTRLYLVPGVAHCGGGPGPAAYDWASNIVGWVESNKAPEGIRFVNGKGLKEALACPYPKKAVYKGTGAEDEAANYTCAPLKN
ncbi:tannase/feruloyl esterase family alpha/beta hydrolase [Edaphobacter flagellatus]|uniref:tannase/feruloyl esterase family alpha/beta hydrolase n=1 Tax=Edaphobacter flagellatus TaxID=1933044 RepID=UPI0021B245B5|nr:tannase/feruloyl esterase family alpha/beta hydrolase [Edaphobacter flagellatus]